MEEKIIKIMQLVQIKKDNTVEFPEEARKLIREVAEKCRKLPVYKDNTDKVDTYKGNGLNFFGEKNYIVTTMACYKDILPDFRSGKFANYMSEKHPDSSIYYGVMVAIPFWGEATEEFNDPTPLSEDRNWKLEIVLPCRQGIRTKSMTELLFCMLRSGR